MDGLRRIVVPVDFSPFSKRAVRAAAAVGRPAGAEFHLLHVIPEFEAATAFGIALPGRDELEAHAARWAARAFDDFLRGEAADGDGWERQVRYGSPAREICRYAAEQGADLVVIASHGRSGFERVVLGSVAEKVLRLSEVSVLVVKEKQKG